MNVDEGNWRESLLMRRDRNKALSSRGKQGAQWRDDEEGVRTEQGNWEGEWVMGPGGAKREEQMKVKRGDGKQNLLIWIKLLAD